MIKTPNKLVDPDVYTAHSLGWRVAETQLNQSTEQGHGEIPPNLGYGFRVVNPDLLKVKSRTPEQMALVILLCWLNAMGGQ